MSIYYRLHGELETARRELTAAAEHLEAAYIAMGSGTDNHVYGYNLAGVVRSARSMTYNSCVTVYHMVALLCAAGGVSVEHMVAEARAEGVKCQEPKGKSRTRAKSAKSKNATAKDAQGIAWPEIAEGVVQ